MTKTHKAMLGELYKKIEKLEGKTIDGMPVYGYVIKDYVIKLMKKVDALYTALGYEYIPEKTEEVSYRAEKINYKSGKIKPGNIKK